MLSFLRLTLICFISVWLSQYAFAAKSASVISPDKTSKTLQCAAFSPYVGKLSPDYGTQPSRQLINQLLDKLIAETPFRCISTYGVINGLEAIFPAAQERHLKVIAILWIDKDPAVNSQSIASGIEVAKAYPDTIIKLSCGNEVRTRHGYAFDGEISRCIESLRKAGVKQPITTIDTWWEWCNRTSPCKPTNFGTQVDWIGINIFPWWENMFSDVLPCTPAKKAADFHIARMEAVQLTYPQKPIILTEFGWPSGPKDSVAVNKHTQQQCGIASKQNQLLVVKETFKRLAKKHWSGIAFEAFSENWKPDNEGSAGGFWGICDGTPPYTCPKHLLPR
jgi:exo-beta-1,3-glucanase (GH17 family)